MRLTRAQLAALEVLVLDGGEVDGSHSGSSIEMRRVNTLAAHSLCAMGLARFVLPERWSGRSRFKATLKGRETWLKSV